jgi:hypothetical protein
MGLDERRRVLKKSGLCIYCLKHAAELECYRQGGPSKPPCAQPECGGKHAAKAHKLLGATDAGVNLAMEEDHKTDEEEEWWVHMIRVEEREESPGEMEDSEPEEDERRENRYITSTCMKKDDSGLEDELEYFWEAPIPSDSDEREEDRWWAPGPQQPSSEEDKEEVQYLTDLLGLGPRENDAKEGGTSPLAEVAPGTSGSDQLSSPGKPAGEEERPSKVLESTGPPHAKKLKRRGLRKKVMGNESHRWEVARRDAWLCELLTDSSESETEENYAIFPRFTESGRWIPEMTGSRDEDRHRQEGDTEVRPSVQVTTTLRGECSGPEEAGVAMSS